MKIELEIDDTLYRECKRKNIDIPTFCVAVLWCYVNNIYGNGNGNKKINYLELKEDFSRWLYQRVRNFILSRSSEIHKSVEADHYLELTALADEVYPEIMKEIQKRIGI